MKIICIYHKNCFDGICAAWVVWKKFRDAFDIEFIPMNYGDNTKQQIYEAVGKENMSLKGGFNAEFIIVDFSLPRQEMIDLNKYSKGLLVLDHHKTAQADCEGLDFCVFDMNESGASLAWKYFFLNESIPMLVKYIKDRDLWLFKEPDSEAINSYIQSFPMTINNYELLNNELSVPYNLEALELVAGKGYAILRYKNTMVENMCKYAKLMDIGGYEVPVVNATILYSEVGNFLCQCRSLQGGRLPLFVAYYIDRVNEGIRQWGLRSIGDFDVSEIAKKYGGGGHKNAAGFIQKLPNKIFTPEIIDL